MMGGGLRRQVIGTSSDLRQPLRRYSRTWEAWNAIVPIHQPRHSRGALGRGGGFTFLGIFIQDFLHSFHTFLVRGEITHRLQKHGTSKPVKRNDITYPRTRKLRSNTFVQEHETACILQTHGFGFGTRIDKGDVET